jgi:NitT/TauT family transport system substrate-binding protein|tara:strand:+ start:339 stop:1364 length:1026 start_codon:yes stop_codon:yes gene_type:complete
MKISYVVGIVIAGIVLGVIMMSYTSENPTDKIRVAFFPSISHAVPIVGIENDIFKENLTDKKMIEVKIFDSGPQVIESLFSNSIDLAYVGPGPIVNGFLKSNGNDLKILAGAANGGASFIIQKDSGLDSIENFQGKRIASPQISNTQDVSLRHYLSTHDLKPVEKGGTVFVINISNPDIYTLFAKGDIDGAWVPEPWATILVEELGGIRLFNESQFWPEKQFSSVLLIGRTNFIEQNPEIVEKWILSNEKTAQWINSNPDKTKMIYNEFMKGYMGKTFPKKVVDESFSNIEITSKPVKESVITFAERADSLGYLGRSGYDLNGIFYNQNVSENSVSVEKNG